METPRQFIVLCAIVVAVWSASARATDTPPPTPTPKPGTLAAFAANTQLRSESEEKPGGPIVIDDRNLGRLSGGAVVNVSNPAPPGPEPPSQTSVTGDSKTRQKWQKKVQTQRRAIAAAEARRAAAKAAIERLSRNRLDSKALDRIAAAEAKLRAAEAELTRARAEFGRIIRAARQEGAEPGWFR